MPLSVAAERLGVTAGTVRYHYTRGRLGAFVGIDWGDLPNPPVMLTVATVERFKREREAAD